MERVRSVAPRPVPRARVIFRRGRFHELVERQLDLFEAETELLAEAAEADSAWSTASAEQSEDLYGDYQLVVDAVGERLYDIRETYARTLADDTAGEYRTGFDRAARKRFGILASFLEGEG
jgi:hypothetical protein